MQAKPPNIKENGKKILDITEKFKSSSLTLIAELKPIILTYKTEFIPRTRD